MFKRIHRAGFLVLPVLTSLLLAGTVQAEGERTMLVLDASGSMWGQLDGKTKIEIAREALGRLVDDWPARREVGLVAYGHRSKGDCRDIETILPVGPLDANRLKKTVAGINPKGKTPLSAAVRQAAEAMKYTEEKATVVLLSDGRETCDMDPCALGTELEKLGVDFTAHVIGFDVASSEDQAGLRCLAENTGGLFIPAANAEELNAALEQTAKAPEPEPVPMPEEPAPAPTAPQAELQAPAEAVKGTLLKVGLKAEDGLDGYVYLYAKGRDKYLSYGNVRAAKTGGYQPAELRLPAATGEFTLKWLSGKNEVLAEAPLTLTDAGISLDVPESATQGTLIEVGLNAPDGLDGYVYLYAKGRDKYLSYGNVRAAKTGGYQPAELRLPAATGEFTLKWLSGKNEVLAEAPLTLEAAAISLQAPVSAPIGTLIEVGLNGPDGLDGYVYLYAKGRDKYLSYGNVREDAIKGYQPSSLRLPATPGEYTLKWLSGKEEVLAEAPLTLEAADISLQAPAQVETGTENLEVGLNGPDGLDGYVYLYAKGRDKYLSYGNVREDAIKGYQPSRLKLPEAPGQYVLKWLSGKEEVLAEVPLEIVEEITEQAPDDTSAAKPAEPIPAAEAAPAGEQPAAAEEPAPADGIPPAVEPAPADDTSAAGPVPAEEQAAADSAAAGLNPVPPDGLDSLDETALKYYQEMGPLELASDLLPQPAYPVWRLHFALYPVMNADAVLSGYQVEASRINLSPRLYQQIVDSFGAGVVDKSLNDSTPGDHYTLPFMIVQNVSAELLTDEVSHDEPYQPDGACGRLTDCAALWQDHEDSDWGPSSTPILQAAPWHQNAIGAPALVRTLARQAGWLQEENGRYLWITPEMPEGTGPGRPWVEVTVDSHAGNGGLLVADWVERVADDSVAAQLVRVLYDPGQPASVQAFRASRCARGATQDSAQQTCP